MPGHSYSGSSASGNSAAVFPPAPIAGFDVPNADFTLTVSVAACLAGRPTFEGYTSPNGVGNPTTNPGNWTLEFTLGPDDGGGNYVETFDLDQTYFIGRCKYGFNASAWSAVVTDIP